MLVHEYRMPNFNRFTIKAQEALQNAQDYVMKHNHSELRPLHLLLALLSDEQTLVRPMLVRANVDIATLEERAEAALMRMPRIFSGTQSQQLYLSQELLKILDKASEIITRTSLFRATLLLRFRTFFITGLFTVGAKERYKYWCATWLRA